MMKKCKNLVGNIDARVWAREFVKKVKVRPAIATDEETMVGWFENVMMAGYDYRDKQKNV